MQQQAFELAKTLLQSDALLVHHDPKKSLTLACDVPNTDLGLYCLIRCQMGLRSH